MDIKVPKNVSDAIDACEGLRREAGRRKAGSADAELKRLRKIDEKRLRRRKELYRQAEFVFAWREAFTALPEAKRIWGLIGNRTRLPIYVGRFWRGEPCPSSRTECARFSFEAWTPGALGFPPFWYEELHKGQPVKAAEKRVTRPQELVDAVHPDFLGQLCRHLKGDGDRDPWHFILQELARGMPR